MPSYPNKLLILFPMYGQADYRRTLTAIDDVLLVHRRAGGDWQFQLRPMVKLGARGRTNFKKSLEQLAADLVDGYTAVIVDAKNFVRDLETEALRHGSEDDATAIAEAVSIIEQRTTFQIKDAREGSDAQSSANRFLITSRERRTKPYPNEGDSLNCRNGIPTPRAEQLWNVIRHELTDVRTCQSGGAAWRDWCDRNRPDMARP